MSLSGKNNIADVVNKGLMNPIVKKHCMHEIDSNYDEIKKIQKEFSRFIGFCILFRNIDDIEEYMNLKNEKDQIKFLINKVALTLGIPKEEIRERFREIIDFAFQNFKKSGFVFHAANSLSIDYNMMEGLKDNNVDFEEQKELLNIEKIYRKYNKEGLYSPLGHAATDIVENKTGWFFDGLPIHATGYANSPQWFGYLCGKSYVYFDSIPEEERNGYAIRDYKKSRKAVEWLIYRNNMNSNDSNEILEFFQKCWERYKDTRPCLMFIPVECVDINKDISEEDYYNKNKAVELFEDIIEGKVNPGKNFCCNKFIEPEKLSYVDLSSILPRVELSITEKNMMDEER